MTEQKITDWELNADLEAEAARAKLIKEADEAATKGEKQ